MAKLGWSPASLADLGRLESFLRARNPGAAKRAVAAIRDAARHLRSFPEIGRPVDGSAGRYRELPVRFGDSGYMIFYRFEADEVRIAAIKHFREDGYS